MPILNKISPENQAAKRDLIAHVCDTALRIIYESSFNESDHWPISGFKPFESAYELNDCIGYGVYAYGYELTPKTGRFIIQWWNYDLDRKTSQLQAIKLLLDQAYYNNLYFEDEFRDVKIEHDHNWFKFTYTPQQ
ncbi:hypothetical protein [Mucilaginibacter sp. SP1R1]|uniref:hypothetical protein n=1 Tax=Mucilaginibacter sp. SP1R1 TaxID=2723091 RepID=UPI001618FC33|nr:hypothetical protein [Mucilaginibacter sp. SP1R1]MBB6152275.1 hypothetical protein [Mucilaginibacter sp. SP1R1]